MHGESLLINCPADVLMRRDPKQENRTHISQDDQSDLISRMMLTNQRPVSRSCDHSQLIRGQCSAYVITFDQSEAQLM